MAGPASPQQQAHSEGAVPTPPGRRCALVIASRASAGGLSATEAQLLGRWLDAEVRVLPDTAGGAEPSPSASASACGTPGASAGPARVGASAVWSLTLCEPLVPALPPWTVSSPDASPASPAAAPSRARPCCRYRLAQGRLALEELAVVSSASDGSAGLHTPSSVRHRSVVLSQSQQY